MRALLFSTLFPSAARPRHGIFVETRLAQMRRCSGMQVRVVAPVPWFPWSSQRFGRYASFARTPREETRDGVTVYHPRYAALPGVGMSVQPFALAHGSTPVLRRLRRTGYEFDVIDAHYLYPDGVAAAMLARKFGVPFVLTARGSDVNLIMRYRVPRQMILRAARDAHAVVTVSAALRERLVEYGVAAHHVRVLRNGVDTALFRPLPTAAARAALALGAGPVVAAVGNLVPEKGLDLVLDALARLPDVTLIVVGEGPEHERLVQQAGMLGLSARVRILPVRGQRDLTQVYCAADALVLASTREGWPNVLLEALACGTPVVATAVGGVPEIVTDPVAGIVVAQRSAEALAQALRSVLARPAAREAVAAYAARFAWDDTAQAHAALCRDAVQAHAAAPARMARGVAES